MKLVVLLLMVPLLSQERAESNARAVLTAMGWWGSNSSIKSLSALSFVGQT